MMNKPYKKENRKGDEKIIYFNESEMKNNMQ